MWIRVPEGYRDQGATRVCGLGFQKGTGIRVSGGYSDKGARCRSD